MQTICNMIPVGGRSLAGKRDAFGCLRENQGNHRALLCLLGERVRAVCAGVSHPMLSLLLPLGKHTCSADVLSATWCRSQLATASLVTRKSADLSSLVCLRFFAHRPVYEYNQGIGKRKMYSTTLRKCHFLMFYVHDNFYLLEQELRHSDGKILSATKFK